MDFFSLENLESRCLDVMKGIQHQKNIVVYPLLETFLYTNAVTYDITVIHVSTIILGNEIFKYNCTKRTLLWLAPIVSYFMLS